MARFPYSLLPITFTALATSCPPRPGKQFVFQRNRMFNDLTNLILTIIGGRHTPRVTAASNSMGKTFLEPGDKKMNITKVQLFSDRFATLTSISYDNVWR